MNESDKDILLDPRLSSGALEALPGDRLLSLVEAAPDVVAPLLAGDISDRADAQIAFTNVARVMALALKHHDSALFAKGVEALTRIWSTGDYKALYPLRTPDFEASLWENLGINLYALGALAVTRERWPEVRELATPSPTGGSGEKSWLRQSQVASARSSDHYDRETILSLAGVRVKDLEPAMDDAAATEGLARFDLVAGMVIGEKGLGSFYPNGAEFSAALVEPFVVEHLRRPESAVRQHVFINDNAGLADALGEYDRMARVQAALARYRQVEWGWRGSRTLGP
jgi:hypothetical protein